MLYSFVPKNLFYPLLLSIIFLGCKKDENSPAEEYYCKGQLNGKPFSIVVKKYNDTVECFKFTTGSRLHDPSFTVFFVEQAGGTSYFNHNKNFAARFYLIKHLPENYSEADKIAMYKVGKYSFGNHYQNSGSVTKEGAIVWITDENGKDWYSELGNNSTAPDYFEVLEIRDSKIEKEQHWKLRVSCNLYDKSGNVIRLENAEVKGYVEAL